jgi:transposase
LIGLESLTDIRERTRRKRGKKASKKQRKANAAYSKWSFAELQSMIAYKALRCASTEREMTRMGTYVQTEAFGGTED